MDVEQCLEAVIAHYPHLPVGKAVPIEAGWDSFVLQVDLAGEQVIFRFPRRPDVKPQFFKEAALLPRLASRLSIRVPQPTFFSEGGSEAEINFSGYPRIPGEALSHVYPLSPALAAATAAQLGRFLSELHSMPEEQLAGIDLPGGDPLQWQQEQLEFYAWARANLLHQLPAHQSDWAAWLWEAYLGDAVNFSFRPCLIHSDLGDEHILVDPETGRLNGVIDWGDARLGDPALDFTGLFLTGGKPLVEQVLDGYSSPGFDRQNLDSFWARIIYYARLIPFHYIRHGMTLGNPVHIQEGLDWLAAMAGQGMDRLTYTPVSNRT